MYKPTKLFPYVLLVALGSVTPAISQSTDSATTVISVQLAQSVTLDSVEDIDLVALPGEYGGSDEICLSSTLGAYSITFTGNGAGGAFQLTNSVTGDTVGYALTWTNTADSTGPFTATAGVPLTGLFAPGFCDASAGESTGLYVVSIDENDVQGLSPGSYVGSLTILAAAE